MRVWVVLLLASLIAQRWTGPYKETSKEWKLKKLAVNWLQPVAVVDDPNATNDGEIVEAWDLNAFVDLKKSLDPNEEN